jgi:hypothetical protein
MNDPVNPLGWSVWKRGARLGLIWALLFFAMTGVVFALMSILGWSTTARAICAALLGPVLASAVIGAWWLARRPVFAEAVEVQRAASEEPEEAHDEPDRRGDTPAV